MKIFWGTIGILILVALGLLFTQDSDGGGSRTDENLVAITDDDGRDSSRNGFDSAPPEINQVRKDEQPTERRGPVGEENPPPIDVAASTEQEAGESSQLNEAIAADPETEVESASENASPEEAPATSGVDSESTEVSSNEVTSAESTTESADAEPDRSSDSREEESAEIGEPAQKDNPSNEETGQIEKDGTETESDDPQDENAHGSDSNVVDAVIAASESTSEGSIESSEPRGEQIKPASSNAADQGEDSERAEEEAVVDPANPEITPVEIEEREDGSKLLDGRYVLRGSGTQSDPFEITWDLLVSSQETYDPRRDKLKIPGRIKMLDGKYVRITGYVAFPIIAEGPNEMLALLNAWDGCCIGIPPTPYDAIEVKLQRSATADEMSMSWGSVTGLFKVEPYLASDWLLGLYVLKDGTVREDL